jgi:hypothetical protein
MIALLLVGAVGPFARPVDADRQPLPPHAIARLESSRRESLLSMAFTADGRHLRVATTHVLSWRVGDWRPAGIFDPFDNSSVRFRVAFLSPLAANALTVDESDRLQVHSVAARDRIGAGKVPLGWDFVVSGDESLLAAHTARSPGQILVVTLPGLRPMWAIDHPFGASPGHFVLSPDGTRLVVTGSLRRGADLTAVLFDVATGRRVSDFTLPRLSYCPAFSPDGARLALPTAGGAREIDVASGGDMAYYRHGPGRTRMVAYSYDGRLLAMSLRPLGPEPGRVLVYDTLSARPRFDLSGTAWALAFSPDGRYLAAAGSNGWVVYDLSGLTELRAVAALRWDALGSDDALPAIRAFLARPREAVELIARHLPPATGRPLSRADIDRLIEQLGAEDFEQRNRASRALAAVYRAKPFAVAALAEESDLEARRRLEKLLADYRVRPGPAVTRELRAIEVLERLNTPEARRLLTELAAGNPDARLTVEARAAFGRVRR